MAKQTKGKVVKPSLAEKPVAKSAPAPALVYEYQCPACTNTAIKTSNKMLGVQVNCQKCNKLIKLDDVNRYKKVK